MCQGYYRHAEGYTPERDGMADFAGRVVHPQTWPADLDYTGKRVVVIGSGATAATVIPAMASDCAHITMLQRSPTYFRIGRNTIDIADELRRLQVDASWIHEIVRRKILYEQAVFSQRCITEPEAVKQELLAALRSHLGPDYDLERHFRAPRYDTRRPGEDEAQAPVESRPLPPPGERCTHPAWTPSATATATVPGTTSAGHPRASPAVTAGAPRPRPPS